MSTNCLVTKLKGTVNADLPVYGEMSFDIQPNVNFQLFQIGCLGGGNTIKCTGDVEVWNYSHTTKLADSNMSYTAPVNPDVSLAVEIKSASQGGRLIITDKYNMREDGQCLGWFFFKPTYFDTLDGYRNWFKGSGGVSVSTYSAKGTLAQLAELVSAIAYVYLSSPNISGSINELSPHKDTIVEMTIGAPANTIEASMQNLGTFTNLTSLKDYRVINCNIEDFVRAIIANGKESGSINATFAPGHKFNGVNVAQEESPLTWTSTTATYKGVTVNL